MEHDDRTYLILTSQVLVSQDMAQCIVDLFPGARVLQFRTSGALLDALAGLDAVDTACLETQVLTSDTERTIEAVAALGGRIVLLGAEDRAHSAATPGWRGLPFPFDTAMLRQRLV